MPYLSFKSEYDPNPVISIQDLPIIEGEGLVCSMLKKELIQRKLLILESYIGVDTNYLLEYIIKPLCPDCIINAEDAAYTGAEIRSKMSDYITEDRVFGKLSYHTLQNFFHADKIAVLKSQIQKNKLTVVYGVGASLISTAGVLGYADMPRWEIQLRYRKGELANWRDDNYKEDVLRRYKRAFFMEWRWSDRKKRELFADVDFFLDTTEKNTVKMVEGNKMRSALKQASQRPFRLVPYFDPGVWGGQWMKEVCNLDPSPANYAWSFDGVPEENSVRIGTKALYVEIPSINIVHQYPCSLLGERVFARFGAEFPIRFDFLDTMGGQNLSLQVHPNTDYARENFGIPYTQDESYYILAAEPGAEVYLGLKENIEPDQMIADFKRAENGEISFPDEKYINKFPCKAHDHFLIPAGTVHCSGRNSMVLEISATPYIFTFKLWDWDRVGLDGLPRPVHIDHGAKVIRWDRTTKWVKEQLVNRFVEIEKTKDYTIETTGLHELEFIQTQRLTIVSSILQKTQDSVHMLNLVEGKRLKVESIDGSFPSLDISYAETFVIPAACKEYRLTNLDSKPIMVMQAFVKF